MMGQAEARSRGKTGWQQVNLKLMSQLCTGKLDCMDQIAQWVGTDTATSTERIWQESCNQITGWGEHPCPGPPHQHCSLFVSV